jgi:hypothetical protein
MSVIHHATRTGRNAWSLTIMVTYGSALGSYMKALFDVSAQSLLVSPFKEAWLL